MKNRWYEYSYNFLNNYCIYYSKMPLNSNQQLSFLFNFQTFYDHESQIALTGPLAGAAGIPALIVLTSVTCLSNQSSCPSLWTSCPHGFGSEVLSVNLGISIHPSSDHGSAFKEIPDTDAKSATNANYFIFKQIYNINYIKKIIN